MTPPRLVIITGVTGSGKSALGLELARCFDGEIINADSLALYRGFDIGTAKPTAAERAEIVHHLVDILDPDQDFEAASYLRAARPLVTRLAHDEGRAALAVGGTGFYLRSLTSGLFEGPSRDDAFRANLAEEEASGVDLHARLSQVDPEAAGRVSPADRVRVERALEVYYLSGKSISQWWREHALAEKPFETLTLVIDREADEMQERLLLRTQRMFADGLVGEVENLLAAGWSPHLKPFGSIGYKETVAHVLGTLTLDEAVEKTFVATRRYAKRQRTWFRGQMPGAIWLHPDKVSDIKKLVLEFLDNKL